MSLKSYRSSWNAYTSQSCICIITEQGRFSKPSLEKHFSIILIIIFESSNIACKLHTLHSELIIPRILPLKSNVRGLLFDVYCGLYASTAKFIEQFNKTANFKIYGPEVLPSGLNVFPWFYSWAFVKQVESFVHVNISVNLISWRLNMMLHYY
jgi:hypothetical protein